MIDETPEFTEFSYSFVIFSNSRMNALISVLNTFNIMNDKIILKWTDTKTVHFLYDNDRKFNRKDVIALRKPTYYLWRSDFSSQEEFEAERRKYVGIGFRVVTFQDGNPDTDIHEGIKALVKNHWDDIM